MRNLIVTTTKQLCFSYVQKYHFIYEIKCMSCAVDTAQWQNWQLPCFSELNISSIMELPKDSLISMYAGINFVAQKQSWELQGIIVTTTKQLCFSYVQKYHFIYELKCISCAVDTAQWQNWQLPCFLELNMSSIISMYAGINFCRTKTVLGITRYRQWSNWSSILGRNSYCGLFHLRQSSKFSKKIQQFWCHSIKETFISSL